MPNKLHHIAMNFYALTLKNIYPLILLICSFGVYFTYYGSPNAMFWDENYHIASAQKHVDGVMYMEPHPPVDRSALICFRLLRQ